jgi:hypothetical protein
MTRTTRPTYHNNKKRECCKYALADQTSSGVVPFMTRRSARFHLPPGYKRPTGGVIASRYTASKMAAYGDRTNRGMAALSAMTDRGNEGP